MDIAIVHTYIVSVNAILIVWVNTTLIVIDVIIWLFIYIYI
jgi:hypothetical protein